MFVVCKITFKNEITPCLLFYNLFNSLNNRSKLLTPFCVMSCRFFLVRHIFIGLYSSRFYGRCTRIHLVTSDFHHHIEVCNKHTCRFFLSDQQYIFP